MQKLFLFVVRSKKKKKIEKDPGTVENRDEDRLEF